MNKHALLLLGVGYLAGIYVASRYRRAAPANASGPSFDEFRQDLMRIHSNMMADFNCAELTLEARRAFDRYKSEMGRELELFQKEAGKKIDQYAKSGSKKIEEIEADLKALYEKQRAALVRLQDASVESLADARNHGAKAWNETIDRLSAQYEQLLASVRRES